MCLCVCVCVCVCVCGVNLVCCVSFANGVVEILMIRTCLWLVTLTIRVLVERLWQMITEWERGCVFTVI